MFNKKNRLFMFWNIGKKVFESQNKYNNAAQKWSSYCQYRFGMSSAFSRENINLMRKFYLYFPIFTENIFLLEWDYYRELVKIRDVEERMFYYKTAIFCHLSFKEMEELIRQEMFFRI